MSKKFFCEIYVKTLDFIKIKHYNLRILYKEKKPMKKRNLFVTVILALALSLTTLAACGETPDNGGGD